MRRTILPLMVLALVLGAGGCTLFSPGEPLDEGSYQAGYGPGCNTGQQRQGGFSDYLDRDDSRYHEDRSYRAGWNAGYNACGRRIGGDPYKDSQGTLQTGGPHP
jgi:hypothetical protein